MVRVVFTTPVHAQRGSWVSSRIATEVDCRTRYLASSGSTYFSDVKSTKVIERSVNKKPGFGPALSGSLGAIAVDHLCGPRK